MPRALGCSGAGSWGASVPLQSPAAGLRSARPESVPCLIVTPACICHTWELLRRLCSSSHLPCRKRPPVCEP